MLRIETMTVNELAREMRTLGVLITDAALCATLELGIYPFAVCYRDPTKRESAHRHFKIYRKLFDQWVVERATDDEGVA